jgi:hypothetical protein
MQRSSRRRRGKKIHSVEMWLALARLKPTPMPKGSQQGAKGAPPPLHLWLAAAKLEESQNHNAIVERLSEQSSL